MAQNTPLGHITVRTQCCHRYLLTLWGHYDVTMISQLWHHMCELCVRSQWHKLNTSPWGHSVVTVWFQRYTRWPHHHEVTVLSQYDVTGTRDDHIIMRSQCCHKMMPTLSGHYDVLMISKLWHHMCEMFVRSQWQKFTTSLWAHSVVIVWCRRDTIRMTTSLWGHNVVTLWCHRYTRWPHHHEVTVLPQIDDLFVRSLWYEFTTSPWGHSVVTLWCHRYMRWLHHHEVTVSSQCDVTDIWDDHIIMRSHLS